MDSVFIALLLLLLLLRFLLAAGAASILKTGLGGDEEDEGGRGGAWTAAVSTIPCWGTTLGTAVPGGPYLVMAVGLEIRVLYVCMGGGWREK